MKVYFVLALMVGLCILSVKAKYEYAARCPEDCSTYDCPDADNCPCGTYRDECKCCLFCNTCPGETCSFLSNYQCSDGYECKHPGQEMHGKDKYFIPGTCVEKDLDDPKKVDDEINDEIINDQSMKTINDERIDN